MDVWGQEDNVSGPRVACPIGPGEKAAEVGWGGGRGDHVSPRRLKDLLARVADLMTR